MLFKQKIWPPVLVSGGLFENLCELKAHVLIATARTSGRTSPENRIPYVRDTDVHLSLQSFRDLQQPGHSTRPRGVVNNVVRPSPRAEARGIFCQPCRRGASPI